MKTNFQALTIMVLRRKQEEKQRKIPNKTFGENSLDFFSYTAPSFSGGESETEG